MNVEHQKARLKFKDKNRLLLGSSLGTLDIISYAKEDVTVTVVVDNLPVEKPIKPFK